MPKGNKKQEATTETTPETTTETTPETSPETTPETQSIKDIQISTIIKYNPDFTKEEVLSLSEKMFNTLLFNANKLEAIALEKQDKEITAKGTKRAKALKRILDCKDKDGKETKSYKLAQLIIERLGEPISATERNGSQLSSHNSMLAYLYFNSMLSDSLYKRIKEVLTETE